MRTGRGDLESPARSGLATHVGEIVDDDGVAHLDLSRDPRQITALAQSLAQLGERAHRADLEPLDEARLGRVRPGNDGALQTTLPRAEELGEDAA